MLWAVGCVPHAQLFTPVPDFIPNEKAVGCVDHASGTLVPQCAFLAPLAIPRPS